MSTDMRTPAEREAERARNEASNARHAAAEAMINEAAARTVAEDMAYHAAQENQKASYFASESVKQEQQAENFRAQRDRAHWEAARAEESAGMATTAVWFLVAALVAGAIFLFNYMRTQPQPTATSSTTVIRREVPVPVASPVMVNQPVAVPVPVEKPVPVTVEKPVVVPVPVNNAPANSAPVSPAVPASEPAAPATVEQPSNSGEPLRGYVEPETGN
jgi:hypothetical protein